MSISIIKPKTPTGAGWEDGGPTPMIATLGFEGRYWFFPERGITVISALEVAHDPHDIVDKGPEYHVSVSRRVNGTVVRADRNDARFVLRAFGMEDATEDNHVPGGRVRNYWRPVADKYVRHKCPCQDDEPAMVEDKGDYIWRGISR